METQENNKMIAEFMKEETKKQSYKDCYYHDSKDYYYHTSWDWLIPVVERINNTGKAGGILYALFNALGNADLENSYKEVVGFIKWYNKKKENETKTITG